MVEKKDRKSYLEDIDNNVKHLGVFPVGSRATMWRNRFFFSLNKDKHLGQKLQEELKKEKPKIAVSEGVAEDAKVEDGDNSRLGRALKQLRKDSDEENAARASARNSAKRGRGTCASVRIGEEFVHGARGIHVFMGPRNWKTK